MICNLALVIYIIQVIDMVSNFETIKKTEKKAAKIVADAYQESNEIKHQAINRINEIQQKAFQDIEKEKTQIIIKAEENANKEAEAILLGSKEESVRLKKQLEANLDKAADFILKRIIDGGSKS